MYTCYLGFGSNLGDRKANILKGIEILKENGLNILQVSSLYETLPFGYMEQPDFLNLAVKAETGISPEQLLVLLKETEKEVGRRENFRWGPRVLDIDILFYDKLVINIPELTIPHQGIKERAFVLVPLLEMEPGITDLDGIPLEKYLEEINLANQIKVFKED